MRWGLWGPGNTPLFTWSIHPIPYHQRPALYLKGMPAKEPAMLIEHHAPTLIERQCFRQKCARRWQDWWFFLGINMKKDTATLLATVYAFLLQVVCGTLLCCRCQCCVISVISLYFVPLWSQSTSFFLIWTSYVAMKCYQDNYQQKWTHFCVLQIQGLRKAVKEDSLVSALNSSDS